jgi:peptide/nickel transport system ATP-binding protein
MLDQSIRMGILGLMERLRTEYGTSFIYITHDMVLARHFCDRLAVMHDGSMVEEAAADDVALRPQHPYTKALIEAVEAESHPRPARCAVRSSTVLRSHAS